MKVSKAIAFGMAVVLTGSALLSCGPKAQQAKTTTEGEYAKEIKEREPDLPKCDRPIGTIVARNFKCKAASCVGNRITFGPSFTVQVTPQVLGEGLSDMLVTALVQTGCFKVLERETLQEIKEELEMLGVKPKQTLKGADFLLTGAITAFEMDAGGMGGGGGLLLPVPILGGVKIGKQKAHIALDLRVVRIRDAEVILAKTVEGKSERWRFGVGGGGIFGSVLAGGWFETFKNTPMEEATRDLIYHTVKLIVEELKPYASQLKNSSQTAPVSAPSGDELAIGGVKRGGVGFSHGNKILWQENFSNCNVVPRGIKILKGSIECVEFNNRKWVATIKGEAGFEKLVSGFAPGKDWALEFKVYTKNAGNYRESLKFYLGKPNSSVSFHYDSEGEVYVSGKRMPDVQQPQSVHTVGIMKKGQTISVFIDGERLGTVQADEIVLGRLKGKLLFYLFADDIETGNYAFITDIKLSQFSR